MSNDVKKDITYFTGTRSLEIIAVCFFSNVGNFNILTV